MRGTVPTTGRFEWLHGLAGARRPSGKDPSRIPLPLFPQEADAEMECKHTAWGSRIRPSRRSPLGGWRSEEHTSELQSHSDLVCRLLLEKKKEKNILNFY